MSGVDEVSPDIGTEGGRSKRVSYDIDKVKRDVKAYRHDLLANIQAAVLCELEGTGRVE